MDKLSLWGLCRFTFPLVRECLGNPIFWLFFSHDDKLEGIQEPGQNEDQMSSAAQSGKKDAQHKAKNKLIN